jgi:large subunit ribosomal protein L4
MEAPKTKNFVNIMNNLKIADKKSLLVLAGMSEAIYLSSRNLQKAKVVSASDINTYDLLNADKLVLTSGSVKTIEESLSK